MSKILIFDSGVGGISVYQAIKEQLPDAEYFYLFDNANFPYGELESEFLINRVCQLMAYMYEQFKPDIVVIGCNTASTLVLPALRERFPIPFVGVVPAIKPAALKTKNKKIGLLATPGTVSRDYTHLLIAEHAQDCEIDMIGSSSLVLQAEKKLHGEPVQLDEIQRVIEKWRGEHDCPDIIVLGCTHFPLLREELQSLIGEHVELVDSGMAIAARVKHILNHNDFAKDKTEMIKVASLISHCGKVFCTKIQDQKKLTQLFNDIGLSQPLYIDV